MPTNPNAGAQVFGKRITGADTPIGATEPVSATGTLTLSGNAVAGETVTIGNQTYTWVAAISTSNNQTPNLVLIAGSASDSIDSLIAAVNATAASQGTLFSYYGIPNPLVTAAQGAGDTMVVTARLAGADANQIVTTETMSAGSWGAATLTGGVSSSLSVAATITPSGTQNVNLIQVGSASFALGQQLAAASLPIVLTAAQLSTLTPLSTITTVTTVGTINAIKGAANLVTSQATSTGTAATLVSGRATRRSVLITNLETGTTKIAYVGPATVTTGNGYPIYPGQSVPFTWVGLIQVIDDNTNHAVLAIADEYDN